MADQEGRLRGKKSISSAARELRLQPAVTASHKKNRARQRETLRQKSDRANAIAAGLARAYPLLEVPLKHRNTFELLITVILSAQCTDEAVNRVTPELFRRYPDPAKLAEASTEEIEAIIRTLGLFRAKARSLQRCARQLVEEFGGQVPSAMASLLSWQALDARQRS